jgi:hypothetical protein
MFTGREAVTVTWPRLSETRRRVSERLVHVPGLVHVIRREQRFILDIGRMLPFIVVTVKEDRSQEK